MTVLRNTAFNRDSNETPPGKTRIVSGFVTLAAGTKAEVTPIFGLSANANIFLTYFDPVVSANAGFLSATYNPATGIITVNSSNGADNNTVAYLVVD